MNKTATQGLRYASVGAFNVAFTLAVFWALNRFFVDSLGVQGVYWISALLGIVNGFVWQRLLVWKSHGRWHSEFLRFLIMNLLTSLVNSLLLLLTVQWAGLPTFPSQVAITGVLVVASFIIARGWVFRTPSDSSSIPSDRRIDVFLQYYKPHVSGLTNMAADLAEFAAREGYDVHVHSVSLGQDAHESSVDGVTLHTYRRSFSVGRAIFSISLIKAVWRMRDRAGVAHVHMPYPESFLLSWIFGERWKFIATYQCDAPMAGGMASLIARALDASQRSLLRRATFVVASSDDYARHSRLRGSLTATGGTAIPATSVDRAGGVGSFAEPGKRFVGFLGRPTSEKGIDVALNALETLPADVCLLLAGPVVGLSEKASFDQEKFARLSEQGRITSVGFLAENQIADFYASLDVFILPSTNSFEAFGIVQVEAISAGTPVVASNLPGVRTIVETTGFGEVAAIGDSTDLARLITEALTKTYDFVAARKILDEIYLTPVPEKQYMALLDRLFTETPAP